MKIKTDCWESVSPWNRKHPHASIHWISLVVGCRPWIKLGINGAAVLAGASAGWRWEPRYLHPIMWNHYYSSFALVLIPDKKKKIRVMDTFPTFCLCIDSSVFKRTLVYKLLRLVLDILVKIEFRLIAPHASELIKSPTLHRSSLDHPYPTGWCAFTASLFFTNTENCTCNKIQSYFILGATINTNRQ